MKKLLFISVPLLILAACNAGSKKAKNNPSEDIISVLSFIRSQAAMVDTSLFSLTKIESLDTLTGDTTDIRREEFRELAKDFLEMPDISQKKFEGLYQQSKGYDPDLKMISFLILPVKESSADIQKELILISPDSEGGKMKKIIIDREWVTRDSSVTKSMIWSVDEYFQVVTRKQLPGQPEKIHTLKVTWTDFTKTE